MLHVTVGQCHTTVTPCAKKFSLLAMSLYVTYLPRGLLDLTLGRKYSSCLNALRTASTSGNPTGRTCNMHSAATLAIPTPEPPAPMESLKSATVGQYVFFAYIYIQSGHNYESKSSGRRRRGLETVRARLGANGASLELEKRVQELEIAAMEEVCLATSTLQVS